MNEYNKGLYVIEDIRSKYYPPFLADTEEEAERNFISLLKDKNSIANMFPDDYNLWKVGEFDEKKGYILGYGYEDRELIFKGKDIVKYEHEN